MRISDLEQKETHVNKLRNKGWRLAAEKKYGEAVQVYDQVINMLDFLKPKETRIMKLRDKGIHLVWDEKYGEAVQVYDQAINLNPQDVLSHLGKGDALRKMKKYEEAIWTYNKANEIWTYNKANKIKKDGCAYAGVGFALMELDRYEDAIKAFGDAFSAFNKKRDDDFDAAINTADRDDYAPGAYEAQFRNHKNCGYQLEEFNELMKKKCKQLVNAGKYREAIKVAYDGLHVANSLADIDLEKYFYAVDSSLEAMGKHGIAEELYNKYSEALAANKNCECKKACYKLCSAVGNVKYQLNIK